MVHSNDFGEHSRLKLVELWICLFLQDLAELVPEYSMPEVSQDL